jgi:hypothetical protein
VRRSFIPKYRGCLKNHETSCFLVTSSFNSSRWIWFRLTTFNGMEYTHCSTHTWDRNYNGEKAETKKWSCLDATFD